MTRTAKSSGRTQATVTARTTANSHHIATKAGNLIPKKNKGKAPDLKGKQKETAPESDEDDSLEKEAALSSPIKGKTSREVNKASLLISLTIVLIKM